MLSEVGFSKARKSRKHEKPRQVITLRLKKYATREATTPFR